MRDLAFPPQRNSLRKDSLKPIAEDSPPREHNRKGRGNAKFPALRGLIVYHHRVPPHPPNLANSRRNLNKINKLQQKSPSGLNIKYFIINNLIN